MSFENAKRITTNANARVASSASGIYDDNLVLLYWENIESKFLEECINYFNDSTQRVIYTSEGTIDFYDISFTQDLYHVHAYYSESDERLYRILMKNAATTAPYTQSDTKWRTLYGRTYESGTTNLTLVMYNVNATQITALTDESIPESITDAIYLIGGTQLTGTWFNIRRESEFNTDTGLYDLRWFVSRYNSKEHIFHSDSTATQDVIRFFNHHLTNSGIDNFENNYYFDSSALGQYYYSTDSKHYTKRNNEVVTDIRFATSTDADLTDKILTWDGSTNTFNSIEGYGTSSDPSYRLNYVDALDQWTLVKTSGDTVSTLATFNETPTPTPGDLPDVGATATFATGYTLARHDSNSTIFKNVVPTTAKRIIDPVVGRTINYEPVVNRETGETDLNITIVFNKNLSSTVKASVVSSGISETIEVQTLKTPSELEGISDISVTAGETTGIEIRPNVDGTFTSIKKVTTENERSGASVERSSLLKSTDISVTENGTEQAFEADGGSVTNPTQGQIKTIENVPLPNGKFRTTITTGEMPNLEATSTIKGFGDEAESSHNKSITINTAATSEKEFGTAAGNVTLPAPGEIKNIQNTKNPDGTFKTTVSTEQIPRTTTSIGWAQGNNHNYRVLTKYALSSDEIERLNSSVYIDDNLNIYITQTVQAIVESSTMNAFMYSDSLTGNNVSGETMNGFTYNNVDYIRKTSTNTIMSSSGTDGAPKVRVGDWVSFTNGNVDDNTGFGNDIIPTGFTIYTQDPPSKYIEKNGEKEFGSLPSNATSMLENKRGRTVDFAFSLNPASPSCYDMNIIVKKFPNDKSICRYENIHGETVILIDLVFAQEADKKTFLDTHAVDKEGNLYEGGYVGDGSGSFAATSKNGVSDSTTLTSDQWSRFDKKDFENISTTYRTFFNDVEKHFNYQIVMTIKTGDTRLSYLSTSYINVNLAGADCTHGSYTFSVEGNYTFLGYLNGKTSWILKNPNDEVRSGIWVDIYKIFGAVLGGLDRAQAILISWNSKLLQWEVNIVVSTGETNRSKFDLNNSNYQLLDIPPTLASSSDDTGIYGVKCFKSSSINLQNSTLPPMTNYSGVNVFGTSDTESIWYSASYSYTSESNYNTDTGMYADVDVNSLTWSSQTFLLSDITGGILSNNKPICYSPAKNTNITLYDYFNLTKEELDQYVEYFQGERFGNGAQCDLKHTRDRDGTYELKVTILNRLGTTYSFILGNVKHHIGNGYPQAPYTCDPGGTVPNGYFKIEKTNADADVISDVRYNENTDTFNWSIKEELGNNKDWNAGLAANGTPPAVEGDPGYRMYEPYKTTETWMYIDVPYLPKDMPSDFCMDPDNNIKDGVGIITTGKYAFQKYFSVKYEIEYGRLKGLWSWRKVKTITSVPRPFYELGFTYSNPDKLGGFYYTNFSLQYQRESQMLKNWTFDDTGGAYTPNIAWQNSDNMWFLFLQLGRSRPVKTYTMEKNFVCIPPLEAWETPNLTHLPDGSKITGTNINKQESMRRKGNYNFIVEKIYTVTGAWATDFTDDIIPTDLTMRACYWNAYYGNPNFPGGLGYQPGVSNANIPAGAGPYLAASTKRTITPYVDNTEEPTVESSGDQVVNTRGANLGFKYDTDGTTIVPGTI